MAQHVAWKTFAASVAVVALAWIPTARAQSDEECLECHGDPEFTIENDEGEEVLLYLDSEKLAESIHGDFECITCHADLDGADLPHEEGLEPVDCAICHEETAEVYANSLHGQKVEEGVELAPRCWDCHGAHEIVEVSSPDSRVAKFKIPFVCGSCHKEGTEVTQTYDIPQDHILSHYSQSIHGEGLFRQGLTVTAVCTDCHTAHNVLPHTDPLSSIFRDNVPITCQKCHGRIEEVHTQVIRGELWEKEPNKVPICVDCHSPHEIRRVYYDRGLSDRDCLECHADPGLHVVRNDTRISLAVDLDDVQDSAHRGVRCAQCHTGASIEAQRPCETVAARVDCSICHAEAVEMYGAGAHGKLAHRGDVNAPVCVDCHGVHDVKRHQDPDSPTYPMNVPNLCGHCHRDGQQAAKRYLGEQHSVVQNYVMSIHGKGLLESGLVVTAMCTDCHTAHQVLPHDDPASSIHRDNVAGTCATCHQGVYEKFVQSIHSDTVSDSTDPLPMCSDCHSAHTISRTDAEGFKLNTLNQCGRCHEEVTESYFETYHGKVSKLGYAATAKCYDCHGAHDILPTDHLNSRLSRQNIVETCGQCHPGSHRRFAGYLTHATHHDRDKYPVLFYTFWFMTTLLVGTLLVAGIHTLLWLPRSFEAMKKQKELHAKSHGKEYLRFGRLERQLHILVIISFLGLAVTGMILKFSYAVWAQWLSFLLGGFESAGFIHRVCAVITFFYFGRHIYSLFVQRREQKLTWMQYLTGPNSMIPNMDDLRDFKATYKWFIGLGPRPAYRRWTYWEKFDYFAVFWGVVIIGSTGLLLWFPEFFTRFLPGWFINVATVIHSDEALLAVGFIFTVHFFNTHLRPDKFPMDTVIFTGRVPLEEFKEDRPAEYEALVESGELEKRMVEPLPPIVVRGMRIFAGTALAIGLFLILLIVIAEIFGYR